MLVKYFNWILCISNSISYFHLLFVHTVTMSFFGYWEMSILLNLKTTQTPSNDWIFSRRHVFSGVLWLLCGLVGRWRETGALLITFIFEFFRCCISSFLCYLCPVEKAKGIAGELHFCIAVLSQRCIFTYFCFCSFLFFVWSALRRESQRHCWQVGAWEEAFRAQYGQLHNYNQRFQLLFVQNPLLEINFCCRHISENFAFISFSHSHTSRSVRNSAPSSRK